jgi:DNA topoisomerase IA
LPDRGDVIAAMKKAARGCDTVYLASDPDREGEAIAWHIAQALDAKNMRRIEFNEITKRGVQRAIQNPRDIDMDRVNAQQARACSTALSAIRFTRSGAQDFKRLVGGPRAIGRRASHRSNASAKFKPSSRRIWTVTALVSQD